MRFLKKKRLWGALIAVALLVYSFWDIDREALWDFFLRCNPWLLLPAIAGVVAMPLVRSWRLKYIIDRRKKLTMRRVFPLYNIGQVLNVTLPALTGQAARMLLFSRSLRLTKTFTFTAIILEVLFDGLTLGVMIFGTSSLIALPERWKRSEIVILVGCLAMIAFFYFVIHRGRRADANPGSGRLLSRLPERIRTEWLNVRASFLEGLGMLRSARHLTYVVLLSIGSWIAHALIVLVLLRAFQIDLPLWSAIVVLIVNTLIIMIPLTPGNVGTFQVACVFGLALFGVPKDKALGFSFVLQAFEYLPVFILGAASTLFTPVRLREFRGAEVEAEERRLAEGRLAYPAEQNDTDANGRTKNAEASRVPAAVDRPQDGGRSV